MNNLIKQTIFILFYLCLLTFAFSSNSSQILPNLQDLSQPNDEKEVKFYSLYGSVAPLTDSLADDSTTTEEKKITRVPEVTNLLNTMFKESVEPQIILPSIKDFVSLTVNPAVKPKMIKPESKIIKLPSIKTETAPPHTPIPTERVNINKADISEIMDKLNLDYFRAKSIVDYRTNNGNFKEIDEIDNVFGITDDLLVTLLPKIKI